MKAVLYYGQRDVRVTEVAEPEPGPGQVKVAVAYNGICGTDLHEYFEGPIAIPVSAPHPKTGFLAPVILGHEASGVVVSIGPGVTSVKPGDRVAIEPVIKDDIVDPHYNLGLDSAYYGLMDNGMLADFAVVKATSCFIIPDGVSLRLAALTEPMAVGYHGAGRAGLSAGDTAVVFGAGPIGIATILALRAKDLAHLIVVEPAAGRRAVAQTLGVTTVDPRTESAREIVLEMTSGRGANAAIDAAGVQASVDGALSVIGKSGRVVWIANFAGPVQIQPSALQMLEPTITWSCAYNNDFEPVLALMSQGRYPMAGWVSDIAIDNIVQDGFEALHRGEGTKVLVKIGGEDLE